VFRRFDRIIAVNEALAEVFRRFGVRDDHVRMILPYSLSQPDETVAVPDDLREFCARHSPLLLAVGGLEPDYEPLFQIAAMSDILAEFPNAGLLIVGDGSMRGEVNDAATACGYAGHIRIAGNVPHAVTLHLIRDADILIRTTLFDGDAISIREALFLETPVIATDNGMRPDGVHLIESGNADDLVAKVRSVLDQSGTKPAESTEDSTNIASVVELYGEILKV
jgi:glycosyltransferase involved in cell wall biosynthesis